LKNSFYTGNLNKLWEYLLNLKNSDIVTVINHLRDSYKKFQIPIVTEWANYKKNPFHVLISCILSLRTKDETTRKASINLFKKADNPFEIVKLSVEEIEKLIYPVGFYKTKAKNIVEICCDIIKKYNGEVPDKIDELLELKGVGRKTANLVVTLGFGNKGICVDTHVHRISNRLGYVKTKKPEETEFALREKLPQEYWLEINDLFVSYGQNICKPVSPFCSKCKINDYCDKNGVVTHR